MTQDKKPREFDAKPNEKVIEAIREKVKTFENKPVINNGWTYFLYDLKIAVEAYQSLLDKVGEVEAKLKDYEVALEFVASSKDGYSDTQAIMKYLECRGVARKVLAKHRGGENG